MTSSWRSLIGLGLVLTAFGVAAGCARSGAWAGRAGDAHVEVALERGKGGLWEIELRGGAVDRRSRLVVYPEHADPTDPSYPAVRGSSERGYGRVRFVPRYAFEEAGRYQVFLERDGESRARGNPHWVEIPAGPAPDRTRVLAVYPSGDLLPENQLKLYIEFSAPMSTTLPHRHLALVDEETGEAQEAVFHQMRDGLWDPAGRRLTVIFDPGRVKRGLANHEAMGPPLSAGRRYRLEISDSWRDAQGEPLADSHSKSFTVVEADRSRPSLEAWRLTRPDVGSRQPLEIAFAEPLDAALLPRGFTLFGPSSEPVAVEVRAGAREESCQLVPEVPWVAGEYLLEVDPMLEDLAGNNFDRLFDHDLKTDSSQPRRTSLRLWLGKGEKQ